MPCESRALRFGSYIAALIFLPAVCCHGQGGLAGSVTGVNVMPAPGAGHDYIHLLSETVDPSVGQVSVRITPPMPPGRGLTIPFSINYDSGSVYLLKNIPSGSLWYNSPTVEGGWHYSVLPTLTGDSWTSSLGSGTTEVDCTFFSAYTFTDASGTGHNLGLGSVSQSGPGVVTGSYPCGTPITLGGDSQVLAYSNGGNSGPGQIYVQDKDGTTYIFSGTAIVSGTPAVSVEDRNGNEITLTEPSSGIYGYPLGYTDSRAPGCIRDRQRTIRNPRHSHRGWSRVRSRLDDRIGFVFSAEQLHRAGRGRGLQRDFSPSLLRLPDCGFLYYPA